MHDLIQFDQTVEVTQNGKWVCSPFVTVVRHNVLNWKGVYTPTMADICKHFPGEMGYIVRPERRSRYY